MFTKLRNYICPVCAAHLGVFDKNTLFMVVCPTEDCKIKWCWKPKNETPIPISYPGMRVSKKCSCPGCATRRG